MGKDGRAVGEWEGRVVPPPAVPWLAMAAAVASAAVADGGAQTTSQSSSPQPRRLHRSTLFPRRPWVPVAALARGVDTREETQ